MLPHSSGTVRYIPVLRASFPRGWKQKGACRKQERKIQNGLQQDICWPAARAQGVEGRFLSEHTSTIITEYYLVAPSYYST